MPECDLFDEQPAHRYQRTVSSYARKQILPSRNLYVSSLRQKNSMHLKTINVHAAFIIVRSNWFLYSDSTSVDFALWWRIIVFLCPPLQNNVAMPRHESSVSRPFYFAF